MSEPEFIDRSQTAVRLLVSIALLVIGQLAEAALRILTIFSLLFTLLTRRAPMPPVRRLSNHLSAYVYRVYRYLTYNEQRAPFPFNELPELLEPEDWSQEPTESEMRALVRESSAEFDEESQ